MLLTFDILRLIAAAVWLRLLVKTSSGVGRVLARKRHRYYDTLRTGIFVICGHCLAFNAQWLFFRDTLRSMQPNELATKSALYLFSAAAAFILSLVLRAYERDCRDC